FATADPWLPLANDFDRVNVARQLDDPDSLLSFYRRVIWFRKQSSALLHGTYTPLDSSPDTFVYRRDHNVQRLLVALNFASETGRVSLPASGEVVLGTHARREPHVTREVELQPVEGVVITL